MKLFLILVSYSSAYICATLARDRQECQAMCDLSSHCEAWSFEKIDGRCLYKKREGYTVQSDSRYDSGFKYQGPWYEPNTSFNGGAYYCSPKNVVHNET